MFKIQLVQWKGEFREIPGYIIIGKPAVCSLWEEGKVLPTSNKTSASV